MVHSALHISSSIPDMLNAKEFYEKVKQIVAANYNDESFNVEFLAMEMNMSRIHLYRKFMEHPGQVISVFIREFRLKKAKEFLQTGNYSVAEAAFSCGFKDSKYFSTCFKKHFGTPPGQIRLNKNRIQNRNGSKS